MVGDVEGLRWGQAAPAGEAVIEEQSAAQQPRWPLVRMRRNHETHRPDQMRRDPEPDPALGQSPAHPPKTAALQHREIAMDQPRRRRRRGACEIALLEEDNPQAAARRIAGEADTVQAAADDREVVIRHEAVEWERSTPMTNRSSAQAPWLRRDRRGRHISRSAAACRADSPARRRIPPWRGRRAGPPSRRLRR
ncbi:hypothetical protein ABIA44_005946 [Bradyrhizobium sp. USDA 329]